jgi:hypothetical protein
MKLLMLFLKEIINVKNIYSKQLLLLMLFFDRAQITILGYQPFRDDLL